MSLKLEIGKKYRTRGGFTAIVETYFESADQYMYVGILKYPSGDTFSFSWTKEGRQIDDLTESSADIIEEITEETVNSEQVQTFKSAWNELDNAAGVIEIPQGAIIPVASTFSLIRGWADARNLIKGATAAAQLEKFFEETGELARALCEDDSDKLKDAIGDCVVVLTILAAQTGLTIEDCIDSAYNEIKDRTGRMIDGKFVKDVA